MLQLCDSEHCFEIDDSDVSWCKCYLRNRDNLIYLGAESLRYLIKRFLSTLKDETQNNIGYLAGYSVDWVLSLAESHCTLYIATDDKNKILLWQDENANVICEIRIAKANYLSWVKELESLLL